MARVITIDPGKSKCGLVLAEISEKKVYEAIIIKSSILGKGDLNLKSIDIKIKSLLRETRDEIKLKGSQVSEIKTRGNFVKKITDFLQDNQNIKFKLEVISLRDSRTAEPIVVEINILKIEP